MKSLSRAIMPTLRKMFAIIAGRDTAFRGAYVRFDFDTMTQPIACHTPCADLIERVVAVGDVYDWRSPDNAFTQF